MSVSRLETPEMKAHAIQQLADAEEQIRVWTERAQELKNYLGELALEVY